MTDILHCAKCKHPLQIVCPGHGTEWTPDRRLGALPPVAPERPTRRTQIPRDPDSTQQRILRALRADPSQAMRAAQVAAVVNAEAKLVGIYLCALAKRGRVTRVGTGTYIRAT